MKKVLILGYGRSGRSAEKYLINKGYEVRIIESIENVIGNLKDTIENLQDYEFAVISPGIKRTFESPIPVIAEVELPFHFGAKPKTLICVTGTNGKTTVVRQIYNSLLLSKKNAVLCGNVGMPITSCEIDGRIVVCEISSFMLEECKILHPNIAVITNVTQDHLDRHGTFEEYKKIKERIFENCSKKDKKILGGTNDEIVKRVCKILHVKPCLEPPIQKHRIEKVGQRNGMTFYNDSKATNIAATLFAVSKFKENITLILCGKTKGQDYLELAQKLPENVKDIIVFGEMTKEVITKIRKAFAVMCMEEAIDTALTLS
ncbi:MAG: hypothetical protein LBH47_03145, partial [Christensenellaceae bacterium]|nr:hypothetical protein [Christensenellaceae bacterium]